MKRVMKSSWKLQDVSGRPEYYWQTFNEPWAPQDDVHSRLLQNQESDVFDVQTVHLQS